MIKVANLNGGFHFLVTIPDAQRIEVRSHEEEDIVRER